MEILNFHLLGTENKKMLNFFVCNLFCIQVFRKQNMWRDHQSRLNMLS